MTAIYKARAPAAAVPDLPSRVHSIGAREYVSGGRPSTCTRVDPIDTRENVTDDTGASTALLRHHRSRSVRLWIAHNIGLTLDSHLDRLRHKTQARSGRLRVGAVWGQS